MTRHVWLGHVTTINIKKAFCFKGDIQEKTNFSITNQMEISQFISFILGRLQVIAVQNYIKIYLNVMLRWFCICFLLRMARRVTVRKHAPDNLIWCCLPDVQLWYSIQREVMVIERFVVCAIWGLALALVWVMDIIETCEEHSRQLLQRVEGAVDEITAQLTSATRTLRTRSRWDSWALDIPVDVVVFCV